MPSNQLDRIEQKVDELIAQSTENKTELHNHIKLDNKIFKVCAGIGIFVFTMHATEAVSFVSNLIQ